MGAGQSVSESMVSLQSIENEINNISQENCINSCTAEVDDIHIIIENSTTSGFNIEAVCNIVGASCVLKATLTNDIHNLQKTKQAGKAMQEDDPINFFGDLFGMKEDFSEASNESTINRITNIMNATCQQNAQSVVSDVDFEIVNSNVTGNVNILADSNITKTNCIIENTARNILSNDQITDQSEKACQGSPILYAIIGIVLCVVVVTIGILVLGLTIGGGGIAAKVVSHSLRNRQVSQPQPVYYAQ